ncbi:hypothetical protein [Streptomyces sp. NPDC049887]|uniref:RICIN domain-containing protein n=1 Tax=unclassified Streptomyces TaxID=2593676 RepID=UPI00343EAF10
MDVLGGSQNPGAVVQRLDREGRLRRRFRCRPSGTPGLLVIGVYGKCCAGARNASIADGTPLVLGHCGGPGRHCRWVDRGSNRREIVEAASGKCLVDAGRRSAIRPGACGNLAEPCPSLWTTVHDRRYDRTSVWG